MSDLTRLHGVPGCHQKRGQQGPITFWREVGLDPEDAKAAVQTWIAAGCPQGAMPFGGRK